MDEKDWYTESEIDEYTIKLTDLALEITRAAEDNNKSYFIGSGLAIDFSVGKITRNHHDIDFDPMLEDIPWWIEWFKAQGYEVQEGKDKKFLETWRIFDESGEAIVDMWPFKLEGEALLVNMNGQYVDSGRHWNETRIVTFKGTDVRIENPERVLEQKLRHTLKNKQIRKQDAHDFRLFGRELKLSKQA